MSQRVFTVATYTKSVHAMGGSFEEPEIGSAVYGKFRDLPPLFTRKTDAVSWAVDKYGRKGIKFTIVEMVIRR